MIKDSRGYSWEYTYDSNGNVLTYKDSDGYSSEYTYDSNGKELTFKDSDGIKRGFDIPEYTMEELVEKLGNFKMVKAKVTFWRTCPVNNQKIDK
jgi:YD repeat-containing protein